ncbi:MAG TPA: hypothetical protein PKD53_18765 [Chloroflexaceae bacterium]|mgnify:CR=1 FL=1|nr:hypothetical protein [Chloroflexaceae bacterium]
MSGPNNVAARILTAQARRCEELAAELAAARAAGAPADEIADLEAQELAARNRYRELAVDMPGQGRRGAGNQRRPWWRFW